MGVKACSSSTTYEGINSLIEYYPTLWQPWREGAMRVACFRGLFPRVPTIDARARVLQNFTQRQTDQTCVDPELLRLKTRLAFSLRSLRATCQTHASLIQGHHEQLTQETSQPDLQ